MSRTLYEISNELDALRETAMIIAEDSDDGVIPDYIGEFIDSVEGERDDKVERIGMAYKDVNAFIDSIKQEKKRLSAMQKQYESEIVRIKEFLSAFIPQGEKIKTPAISIGWRSGASVMLHDGIEVEDLPEKYQTIKITEAKTLIKQAIANDEDDISEYAYIDHAKHIQIK